MRYLFLCLTLLLAIVESKATVWQIWPSQSIQSAANQATDGDTILIHDGIYFETVILYEKRLTIGSAMLLDGDTSHISRTIIEPDFSHPDSASCFVYAYQTFMGNRLVGVSLRGGLGTEAGPNGPAGGAIRVFRGRVSLEYLHISESQSGLGGGVSASGASRLDARVDFFECAIENCHSMFSGGGFHANDCSTRVERCRFRTNTSGGNAAGAIFMDCFAEILDCDFYGNMGADVGGIQYLGCWGAISNCRFDFNASATYGYAHLQVYNSDAPITSCIFVDNQSHTGSVDLLGNRFPIRFIGNVVAGNTAMDLGGTVRMANGVHGEIAYCIFQNNASIAGGTLSAVNACRPRVHHCVFAGNQSLEPEYGSVFLGMQSPLTFDSNIIAGNGGQTFSCPDPNLMVEVDARYNYWGDPSGPYHPTLNPEGRGDTLLQDSILFIPWLTEPPDTTMPSEVTERNHSEIASTWRLLGVYPNPFNSAVRIILAGFTRSDFRLTLHNLLGQEVAVIHAGALTGGELSFTAPPSLATGVYFLRAASRDLVETKKVLFMK